MKQQKIVASETACDDLVGVAGVEPTKKRLFPMVSMPVSTFVSIIVSEVKILKLRLISRNVGFSYVCVDLLHGVDVGPSTNFHSDSFWNSEVISKGSERVSETMNCNICYAGILTDFVDSKTKRVLLHSYHAACWLAVPLYGCCKFRNKDRYVSC